MKKYSNNYFYIKNLKFQFLSHFFSKNFYIFIFIHVKLENI